jgi:hypothetical protein
VPLDEDRCGFFDGLDELTDQIFTSTQSAGLVLGHLRRWREKRRPVGTDAIIEWARQRELDEHDAGVLADLVLAAKDDDDPEARPPH